MNESHVLLSMEDALATITLNRPDKLNAISMAMLDQIENMVAELEKNRAVRWARRPTTAKKARLPFEKSAHPDSPASNLTFANVWMNIRSQGAEFNSRS